MFWSPNQTGKAQAPTGVLHCMKGNRFVWTFHWKLRIEGRRAGRHSGIVCWRCKGSSSSPAGMRGSYGGMRESYSERRYLCKQCGCSLPGVDWHEAGWQCVSWASKQNRPTGQNLVQSDSGAGRLRTGPKNLSHIERA